MKTKNKMLALFIILIIALIVNSKKVSAQQNNVSFQVFYDQLSPYGQWVDYPNYGYVWIPDAGPDFVPYSTRGSWIMTAYGWTWFSSYDWGWAPFHYGRWGYDNYYGWYWVPDGEWGPAWVNWRSSEGFYGWAPMEPGVTISFSLGMNYNSNYDHWIFVRDRYIGSPNMNRYYVSSTDHDRIIRNSRVITNTYVDKKNHSTYISGPAREDVQRITGERVNPVAIKESNKPGQDMSNGQLHLYRPKVVKNSDPEHRSAPSQIVKRREAEQPSQRAEVSQQRYIAPKNNSLERQSNNIKPKDNFSNTYNVKSNNPVPPVNTKSKTNNFNNNYNTTKDKQQSGESHSSGSEKTRQRDNVKSPDKNNNEKPVKTKAAQDK
jgi:Family of unknown function (DUF6600)